MAGPGLNDMKKKGVELLDLGFCVWYINVPVCPGFVCLVTVRAGLGEFPS